jgi:hypothetical protein
VYDAAVQYYSDCNADILFMNNTIVDAIVAHRSWMVRFRTALAGINTEVFDLLKVRDDTACVLGRWLLTEQSSAVLGVGSYNEIVALHRTFHDKAGTIAEQIKRYDSRDSVSQMMIEFDELSKQLVHALIQAKTRA